MIFIRPWPPALAVVPSSLVLVETLPNVAGLVKLTVVFGAERLYHSVNEVVQMFGFGRRWGGQRPPGDGK